MRQSSTKRAARTDRTPNDHRLWAAGCARIVSVPSIVVLAASLAGCGGCQPGTVPDEEGAGAVKKPAAAAAGESTPTRGPVALPTARDLPTMKVERERAPAGQQPPGAPPPPAAEPEAEEEPEEADCSVIVDGEPDYGEPPLTVHFTVDYECTEGGGTVSWDFGDGSGSGNDDNPSHTYRDTGEYVAVVTVTTPDGATATDEIDITVEAEGEEPPDVEPGNP